MKTFLQCYLALFDCVCFFRRFAYCCSLVTSYFASGKILEFFRFISLSLLCVLAGKVSSECARERTHTKLGKGRVHDEEKLLSKWLL